MNESEKISQPVNPLLFLCCAACGVGLRQGNFSCLRRGNCSFDGAPHFLLFFFPAAAARRHACVHVTRDPQRRTVRFKCPCTAMMTVAGLFSPNSLHVLGPQGQEMMALLLCRWDLDRFLVRSRIVTGCEHVYVTFLEEELSSVVGSCYCSCPAPSTASTENNLAKGA